MSDQDAAQVNFTPVPSSVGALRGLAAPAPLPQSSRVAPTELTVFTVTAQLVEMKLEEDRDIHMVIAEPSDPTATMITEFPDADQCSHQRLSERYRRWLLRFPARADRRGSQRNRATSGNRLHSIVWWSSITANNTERRRRGRGERRMRPRLPDRLHPAAAP